MEVRNLCLRDVRKKAEERNEDKEWYFVFFNHFFLFPFLFIRGGEVVLKEFVTKREKKSSRDYYIEPVLKHKRKRVSKNYRRIRANSLNSAIREMIKKDRKRPSRRRKH